MRILLEAHHPAHVHFWKNPASELLGRGNEVLMLARDRDVMRQLLDRHDWIPRHIPRRHRQGNRFPLLEMLLRQTEVAKSIHRFRPRVVASIAGSYCQSARLLGCRNIIFTDSEFQHFNHAIAHPFAHEIHTPYCFYKDLGSKQKTYRGIHELSFLSENRFRPDGRILEDHPGIRPNNYVLIRLSAWNTFHDIRHHGVGKKVLKFIERFKERYRIIISAEEDCLPPELKQYASPFAPDQLHHVLALARFVLTEGASTASEAACLGTPTVYINSTEPRGYLQMLESSYGLVHNFREADPGISDAINWLDQLDDAEVARFKSLRSRVSGDHVDVATYVADTLEEASK
jgi:predicted glycosyltransferase